MNWEINSHDIHMEEAEIYPQSIINLSIGYSVIIVTCVNFGEQNLCFQNLQSVPKNI